MAGNKNSGRKAIQGAALAPHVPVRLKPKVRERLQKEADGQEKALATLCREILTDYANGLVF